MPLKLLYRSNYILPNKVFLEISTQYIFYEGICVEWERKITQHSFSYFQISRKYGAKDI